MLIAGNDNSKDDARQQIISYHERRFEDRAEQRTDNEYRHAGLELKFPVVTEDGQAVDRQTIEEFWDICEEAGWEPIVDPHSKETTGVRATEAEDAHAIRTTTGYCVLEFSVCHQRDLYQLREAIREFAGLAIQMRQQCDARVLGLGIHPLTPPSDELRTDKGRHLFWDAVLPPRESTPHDTVGNVDLFTVIADNQVHVDIDIDEAIDAINALNAVAPALLAVTANSTVWNGAIDHEHVAVRELFWDWWLGDTDRYGLPPRPFEDFADYVLTTTDLAPVYIKRDGESLGLQQYETFLDYYTQHDAETITQEGETRRVTPGTADIDLHDRAFWWNARLTRFATAESRVCCQQGPSDLLAPAAAVLGLVENLNETCALMDELSWAELAQLRVDAAHRGLEATLPDRPVTELLQQVLTIARNGLQNRDMGEEEFLQPLWERLNDGREPARRVREIFDAGGIQKLIDEFACSPIGVPTNW